MRIEDMITWLILWQILPTTSIENDRDLNFDIRVKPQYLNTNSLGWSPYIEHYLSKIVESIILKSLRSSFLFALTIFLLD